MSYGLKGNVREMVASMEAFRQNSENPEDVALPQYLADNYRDNDGNGLSVDHLYEEIDVDPRTTTVNSLMSDDDNKYLMSEIIRDGIRRGMGLAQRERLAQARREMLSPGTFDGGRERFMSREVFLDPVNRGAVQASFYNDLIVREETVSQPTVTIPKIELSDAELKDSEEAATIEEGTVVYDSKLVKLQKKARGFKVTYESLKYNSLSLAQLFFEDAGRILAHTLNGMAVEAIVDGDQDDSSEAAAVIGVEDTNNGVTWFDLSRVAIQFGLIGRVGTQVIGNATTALDYLNLDEVKNKQFPGAPLLATQMRSPLTMPEELFVSTKVGSDQVVVSDPSMSLVQLTSMPLMVETEKIVSKQIEGAYASIQTGFAKLQRNASVVIDGSIAFNANGFPAFMNPYSE